MMSEKRFIETNYGKAHLNKYGYYVLSSRKRGEPPKPLHRAIYEDNYNCTLPSNIVVHHKDMDKTNNDLDNLEAMTIEEHIKLHHIGSKRTDETKMKMCNTRTNTGLLRVNKWSCNKCSQGYRWVYRYNENGKVKTISSMDIAILKKRVLDTGLKWEILDYNKVKEVFGGIP